MSTDIGNDIIFDGAHWSPWPMVPEPTTTVGRDPLPVHGAVGSMTVPVTPTGLPLTSRDAYITFLAVPGHWFLTPGICSTSGIDWDLRIVPGLPVMVAGGV